MKSIIAGVFFGVLLFGCKGPKGDMGVQGLPGRSRYIATYTGSIPNSGIVSFSPASADAIILGYVSLSSSCCWQLVGSAPANAPSTSQWFEANNEAGTGTFGNAAGYFYKIVVFY